MALSQKQTDLLKQLAHKYMEFASLPVQTEKLDLWKALNRCQMKRPMVVIDQLPWHELTACDPEALQCQIIDPFWGEIELNLRKALYQWERFPVDMVLEPFITIPSSVSSSGYGIVAAEETIVKIENETASSHKYTGTITDSEDIAKIKDIQITMNHEQDTANLNQAQEIFKGIAPVVLSHGLQFHLGVWDRLSTWLGVENAYFDLLDRPEFIHALMRRITDATINGIKQANSLQVHNDISPTCHCSYIYTDELLPEFGKGKGNLSKNSWAYGMAQLFTSVSADVTQEFELPYISEMAQHFGMIYYGCCDRLDDRMEIIKKIPNLRKISCSPWSNREQFAEKIGSKLVMSNKPTPAYIATDLDSDLVDKDLERTIKAATNNNVNLEIILKDISTIGNDPTRLSKWHEIAMKRVLA